jgi:hypothetical protein
MLIVRVFVADPQALEEHDAVAIRRVKAAASRFAGQVETRVIGLDDDEAVDFDAAVSPTIMIGDMVISVGAPPLAGQIKRSIEMELEGS